MRFIIYTVLIVSIQCDDYHDNRSKILELEAKLTLGGNITLTNKEAIVNNCLMQHKFNEINYGFHHPEHYNFSRHFFTYKDKIPNSKVYKIIKKMPKGAILHIHDSAILGPDYLLKITYMDHLFVCLGKPIQFLFSNSVPNISCDVRWQLMSDIRRSEKNVTKFDLKLRKQFSMVVENPDQVYPTIKESWGKLMMFFNNYYLWAYRPVWEKYIQDFLKAFLEDQIMYVELRSSLPELYELNGTVYDKIYTAKVYRDVIKKFVKKHPDFQGAKIILAPSRNFNTSTINSYITLARDIKKQVPDLIIGFDLVGQEDPGTPLLELVPILNKVKDLDFFFHAGETNWYGTHTDENLIDALLLGARRIGHAYALTKHPVIMRQVIEKNIGIEVNVVSNAVLSLVRDVRNHPLSVFLSVGLPVVLSSDDPGAWEANPLSDDFYVVFVGVASKLSDLRMLKALALNSLQYSALDSVNKQKAIRTFNLKWNRFIDKFDCRLY